MMPVVRPRSKAVPTRRRLLSVGDKKNHSAQLGLFETEPDQDEAHAALSRERMRETIDRLGVILMDGSFKRAMRLVSKEEGGRLGASMTPRWSGSTTAGPPRNPLSTGNLTSVRHLPDRA